MALATGVLFRISGTVGSDQYIRPEQLDSAIAAERNQYKQTLAQFATLEDVIVKDKDKTRLLKIRTEPAPNSATLREAMIDALRDRKLSAVELAVAVRESGYKTFMSNRKFCQQVRYFLGRDKRFKKVGGDLAVFFNVGDYALGNHFTQFYRDCIPDEFSHAGESR